MTRGNHRGAGRASSEVRPFRLRSSAVRQEPLEPRTLFSGNLDLSFSADGKATVDFGPADAAVDVRLLADGKTVVVGTGGAVPQFAVARFTAAGALDNTFSGDGKATVPFAFESTATSAALQADGKLLVAGFALADDGLENFRVARLNVDGSPDTTFGTGGNAIVDFGGVDVATGIALMGDGRIVVTGTAAPGLNTQFAVARLTAAGQLDPSFGGDGRFAFDFGLGFGLIADGVAIQPDQKILLSGTANVGGGADIAVARVTLGGALDTTFSGDGRQTINFGNSDRGTGVRAQADGKIVVGGTANDDLAVARLLADGSPDLSFAGGAGQRRIDFNNGGLDKSADLAVLGDGRVLLAGSTVRISGDSSNFALAQLNPDGSPDSSFGIEGKVITDFGGNDVASAVSVRSDGSFAVAGTNGSAFAVGRYQNPLPVGVPDRAWAGSGTATIDLGGTDVPREVLVQSDGKVLVTGTTGFPSDRTAVARLNANGTPDAGFGAAGKTALAMAATSMALQPDGKIVVGGFVTGTGATPPANDFRVARLNANGSLDGSFGTAGVAAFDFGGRDQARAIAVQADGRIVVLGDTLVGQVSNWALLRLNANGTPDATFSGDGKLVVDVGPRDDSAAALVVQADGRIVAAGSTGSTGFLGGSDMAVVRVNANGTPDPTFSGDGKQLIDVGPFDFVAAVRQQRDGKLVLVGDADVSFNADLALVRLRTDGAPDPAFNGTGRFTLDLGGNEFGTALAVQPDGKLVVAGSSGGSGSNVSNGFVARVNPSGGLDVNFGVRGIVGPAVSASTAIFAAALQPDGKIVAAGANQNDVLVFRLTGTNGVGRVAGVAFDDANRNGTRQAGEGALAGVTVFLDANNNGVRDGNERSVLTDATGTYAFANLAPGTYNVRTTGRTGFTVSTPAGAVRTVNVTPGTAVAADFGLARNTGTMAPDLRVSSAVVFEGSAVHLKGRLVDPDAGDNLTLKVDWGDGTVQTFRPGLAPFDLTHRYARPPAVGQYRIRSTWFDQTGAGNARDLFVTVRNAWLDQPSAITRTATVGVPLSNAFLGTFRDRNALNRNPATFAGTVYWGDGSRSKAGFAFEGSVLGGGGAFSVTGSHTYKKKGTFSVWVVVRDTVGPARYVAVGAKVVVG